jgi:magnesium transporter
MVGLTAKGATDDFVLPTDPDGIKSYLNVEHPVDGAALLETLAPDDARRHLLEVPIAVRAEIFGYLRPKAQVAISAALDRGALADIMIEMDADDRADLFNRLEPDQQDALFPGIAQAEREDIRRLAAHTEGSAGAIMTSDYATLAPDLTARDAIDALRREAPDKETIYRAYVVDDHRRLVGAVRLRDLILAAPDKRIADLMETEPQCVKVTDNQEHVAHQIARYDVLALPVIGDDGRLVGIITHDDALDALEEEATEDFHKLGTVGKLSQSVREASIPLLYRKRVAWLALLVFGNLFSGAGIAYFEETIASYVALVFFLPLLIDSSGNAGSQSATIMVRALATGDVGLKDWWQLIRREIFVAAALGATMAIAVAPIGYFRGSPEIAVVVALTMILVVLIGSLVGMSLPFLLSRLRLDPATASAPLVTSIADATGVIIYFSLRLPF